MSYYASYLRTDQPEEFVSRLRITGAGAANPTNSLARGATVTYLSATGKYRITWADNPGNFTGAAFAFQATTPSDLARYSVIFGDYTVSGTSYTLDFWVYDGAAALVNLTSTQKLNLMVTFKRAGSTV